MTKKPAKPKRDNPAQSEQFIKAARELGVDEDDAAFVEKLKKIAKAKPPAPKKPQRVTLGLSRFCPLRPVRACAGLIRARG